MFLNYTFTSLMALSMFIFVSSITPGPNNLMLLHSGARFGFRATIPHMLGISIGFAVMVFLCAIGVAAVVFRYPAADVILKTVGCAYMLWLSYKLWLNGIVPPADIDTPSTTETQRARPLTFMQAALFQYVNPKAWMMALSITASYLPTTGSIWSNSLVACTLCIVINLFCIAIWARGGELLHTVFHRPRLMRAINALIVAMTVYCAISIWF